MGNYFGGPAIEQIPLTQMVGGDYQLRVQLLDPSETLIAEEFAPITVSPRSAIARPHFYYRRAFNPEFPGLLALARGKQLWALGRNEEARAAFQESVAAGNPELPMARWLLAGVFLAEGDGDAALELLAPLEEALPGQYEVLAGLGFARFLRGELEQATGYLEKAITIRQPDTNLLNALGDIVSWGTSKRLGTSISARWRSTLTRKPSSGIWKRSAKAGKWLAFTTPARVKTLTSEITSGATQLPDIAVVYTRGTNGARLRSKVSGRIRGPES